MMTFQTKRLKRKSLANWGWLPNRIRATTNDRRGVAAIEFAIIAPILVVMAISTVELGLGIYRKMQVQFAAQAGVHYAATHGFDASSIANAIADATAQSDILASPAPVQYCGCATAAGVSNITCGSACPKGSIYGTYVQVSTQANYTTILPYPGLLNNFTFTAQSNVRIQ